MGKAKIQVSRFAGWTLAVIPFLLFIVFVFSCAWTYPVFKLTVGGTQYLIGAQGYTDGTRSIQVLSPEPDGSGRSTTVKAQYLYQVPASWPKMAQQVPPALVAHLVLSILLAMQVALTAAVLSRPVSGKERRHDRMMHPWLLISAALAVGFAMALSGYSASLWAQAQAERVDMTPDVLGYMVVIVGLLLESFWFMLVFWSYCCGARVVAWVSSSGKHKSETKQSPFDRLLGGKK